MFNHMLLSCGSIVLCDGACLLPIMVVCWPISVVWCGVLMMFN